MKTAGFLTAVFILVILFSAVASAAVTLPDKEPDIVGKTAQLDKAAIVYIQSVVTGTAAMPSYQMVQGAVAAADTKTIVGTWQSTSETVTFTETGQFSGSSPTSGAFSGTYSTAGNILTLNYVLPNQGTIQFTFSIASNTMTLSNPQFGTDVYTRESAQPQDSESTDVVENAKNLEIVKEEGTAAKVLSQEVQNGGSGSGFIVSSDGYIVTNAHVVLQHLNPEEMLVQALFYQFQSALLQDASQYYNISEADRQQVVEILLGKFIEYFQQYGTITNVSTNYYVMNGVAQPGEDLRIKSWPATIKREGTVYEKINGQETWGKDVAVIKVEKTNLPTVKLGDSSKVQAGDSVFIIGYPGIAGESLFKPSSLLEATITRGVISAKRTLLSGVESFQTDAAINHGNSGGPAYNDKGEVIGIATFGPSTKETDIQDVGFMLPINLAKQFMNEINVQNKQGALDEKYNKGLEAFWRKDCGTTIQQMKSVLVLYPGHPYAQEYITECERAIEAGEASMGIDLLSVIILVVILIVVGGAYFALRGRLKLQKPEAQQKPAEEKKEEKKAAGGKFCSECGKKVSADEKFCGSCGAKVK